MLSLDVSKCKALHGDDALAQLSLLLRGTNQTLKGWEFEECAVTAYNKMIPLYNVIYNMIQYAKHLTVLLASLATSQIHVGFFVAVFLQPDEQLKNAESAEHIRCLIWFATNNLSDWLCFQ